MSGTRAWIAAVMITAAGVLAHASLQRASPRAQLGSLPYTIAAWTGRDAAPSDAETLRILAADAYLNRSYSGASGTPIDLYIAYYGHQQPGVSIHSPLHCLPGTGWEPLEVTTTAIAEPDGTAGRIRRLVVRKNMERAVVLYWYAVHGRTIANETLSKAWLLHDSVRFHRSDAALVRIVVPVRAGGTDAAQRDGLAFAHDVLPYLPHLWS
jgi:EpsI family protein